MKILVFLLLIFSSAISADQDLEYSSDPTIAKHRLNASIQTNIKLSDNALSNVQFFFNLPSTDQVGSFSEAEEQTSKLTTINRDRKQREGEPSIISYFLIVSAIFSLILILSIVLGMRHTVNK